ncbi:MAG: response regulator transcription factor [Chlamydiae bacterium]|nr:response regulator transcription factor [Chlamydiota bacterium]MBI3266854.1 response regulator transcription factor [Chlamydiota bacterium]
MVLRTKLSKIKVLVVDDHPVVRQGLTQLINQEKDLVVCGDVEGGAQGLDAIKRLSPDVVIVDISLRGMSGLDLIKNIKVRYPDLPILVLSMHDESLYAERVLRAGARGYIMKEEAIGKVLVAIRCVVDGEVYVSQKMTARILEKSIGGRFEKSVSPVERLSDRELEVFQMIGKGFATRQVAKQLHLSVKTVETYRENIKEKMKLDNATELVRHAIQWVEGEGVKR